MYPHPAYPSLYKISGSVARLLRKLTWVEFSPPKNTVSTRKSIDLLS